MIIRKMTARFGPLDGRTLELEEGLNIITAPNESGKSSWCAFIRAMLYGVDPRRRGEKEACRPWNGGEPQGLMELELPEGRMCLRRSADRNGGLMRRCSAVYAGTEDPFPLPEGEVGLSLTGVTADVFCRSAFIAQGGARVSGSPDLEKRMAAMVSSGEEGMSYSDADERLRQWQRERVYNARVGMNARLETELAQSEARLGEIQRLYAQAQDLRREIDALSRSAASSEDAGLEDLSRRLRRAEEAERRAREQLDRSPLGARDSREAALELGRAKSECAALLEKQNRRYSLKKLIAPALLLVLSAALGAYGLIDWRLALIPGALLLVLGLLTGLNRAAISRSARDAAAKRRAILRRYDVQDEAGLDALAAEHSRLWDAWLEEQEAVRTLRSALHARLHSRPEADSPAARLARKREALAGLEGKLSVLGDPAGELERRAHLRRAMAENQRQKESIDLARKLLRQAEQTHLADFSPRLTRRCTQLFARVTGERYDALTLDRELNISARLRGDALGHDSAQLSAGTRDILYLCLRIALCELALPPEKNVPLILDDALCALDDGRCAAFLELLLELSRERQIILFTCHGREAAYLRRRSGVHTPEVY